MAKKKVTEDESSRKELSAQINAELDKAIDDLTLFDDDLIWADRRVANRSS